MVFKLNLKPQFFLLNCLPGHGGTALPRRGPRPRPVSSEGGDQLGGDNGAVVGPVVPEGRNQLVGHLGTARHVGK